MSIVRVSVEWLFGDVISYYKLLDFHENLKIQLSAGSKMYSINVPYSSMQRHVFYRNSTSSFFECNPPSIQEYFRQ